MSVRQRLIDSCVTTTDEDGLKVCSCEITVTDDEWMRAGDTDERRESQLLDDARGACQLSCDSFKCQPYLTAPNGVRKLVAGCVLSNPTGKPSKFKHTDPTANPVLLPVES